MFRQVTITLDSGCFLTIDPDKKPAYREIGYFQSSPSVPDIGIQIDGEVIEAPELSKMGEKWVIEICHMINSNTVKRDGVKQSKSFHDSLLHTKDLYDVDVPADPGNFDFILLFQSGRFCPSKVKTRAFNYHNRQKDNSLLRDMAQEPKKTTKPIAHDLKVFYTLGDGESIEFQKDGNLIWSSKGYDVGERIDIEIVAENSTAQRFYCDSFKEQRGSYWLPNEGDPPPLCSAPPCDDPRG
jgi:hypothetical protein